MWSTDTADKDLLLVLTGFFFSHFILTLSRYVMLEQFLMKYGWTGAGMILISIPILTSRKSQVTSAGAGGMISERTEYYTIAKHLLMSGGDAMERLMTAYKEVVELAGYTQRVANMFTVFDDCSHSRYMMSSRDF